jgi:hypothetical protein
MATAALVRLLKARMAQSHWSRRISGEKIAQLVGERQENLEKIQDVGS